MKTLANSRQALVRLVKIIGLLQRHPWIGKATMAEILRVSAKTIQRDLVCLRYDLRLPIEYLPSRFAWRLTKKRNHLGIFGNLLQPKPAAVPRLSGPLTRTPHEN